ncbi:hypothetical protein BDV96DRAFT_270194 [Lophiotrema nucula]|uniref:Glutaredoxin-like protein n=1 Tax=Lophiotrema nucula TaxID=690887 RepID=A0A6A5ZN43_9PLEO|nr:hypothetical protein BDV96DRAFT_270194 [Lophiotrema nucula]
MFRASSRLLGPRVTLFTRANCSLCDTAKTVVENVKAKRSLEYAEINVMEPGQEKWKSVYEFDTPVIHIDKVGSGETTTSAEKLLHRFKEQQVIEAIDRVERS